MSRDDCSEYIPELAVKPEGCAVSGGGSVTGPLYEVEITCVAENDQLYLLQIDQTVGVSSTQIFDTNLNDVTGTVTPVKCGGKDFEFKSDCFQDITDPSVKYSRLIWFDTSDVNAVVATVWLDSDGAVVAAPNNVEACTDTLDGYVPHVNGCIKRAIVDNNQLVCTPTTNSYAFTTSTWLFQTRTDDGSVVDKYSFTLEFVDSVTADLFEAFLVNIADPTARIVENIANGAFFIYLHSTQFASYTRLNATQISVDFDAASTQDVPLALPAPCTDPITDSQYTSSNQQVNGIYNGFVQNDQQPIAADIVFDVTTYVASSGSGIVGYEHIPAKQIVAMVDGVLVDSYYSQGDLSPIIFDPVTDVFENSCDELPLVDCDSSTIVDTVFAPTQYDFQPLTPSLGADYVYNFEDYATNTANGLVIDGATADMLTPQGLSISFTVPDGAEFLSGSDNLGNTFATNIAPILNLGTDPSGNSFVADMISDLQSLLSDLGLSPATIFTTRQEVVGSDLLLRFDLFGTENQLQANFLQYITFTGLGDYFFFNLSTQYETDLLFDASAISSDPTNIVLRVRASVPNGEPLVMGLMINGIINQANPYYVAAGTGNLVDYFYTFDISGIDMSSTPYTITASDLANPVYAWIYFQLDSPNQNVTQLDGAELIITSAVGGTVTKVLGTNGCNDDRRDDLLKTLVDTQTLVAPIVEMPQTIIVDGFTFSFATATVRTLAIAPLEGVAYDLSTDGGNSWSLNLTDSVKLGNANNSMLDVSGVLIRSNNSGDRIHVVWETI